MTPEAQLALINALPAIIAAIGAIVAAIVGVKTYQVTKDVSKTIRK